MDKYKKAFDNMKVPPEVLERAKAEAAKAADGPADKPGAGEAGIGFTVESSSNKVRSIESARNRKRSLWTLGAAAACFAVVIGVWATGGLPALNTPVSEELQGITEMLSTEGEPETVYVEMTEDGEAVVQSAENGSAESGEAKTGTDNKDSGDKNSDTSKTVTTGGKEVTTQAGVGSGENSGKESVTSQEGRNTGNPQDNRGEATGQVFSESPETTSSGDTEGSDGNVVMTAFPSGNQGVSSGDSVDDQQVEGQASANPLQEINTVEDAEAALGYKIKAPSGVPSGYSIESVNVIGGNLVSITYAKGSVKAEYRYERVSADISGDYNNYAYSTEIVTGAKKYVLKGGSENDIRNITCIGSSESCSYTFDTPVTTATAIKWISALN